MKNKVLILFFACQLWPGNKAFAQIEGTNELIYPLTFYFDSKGTHGAPGDSLKPGLVLHFGCQNIDTVAMPNLLRGTYAGPQMMSDTNGKVLFYVSSLGVYDSSFNHIDSLDSVGANPFLIVPWPKHPDDYFIFYGSAHKPYPWLYCTYDILTKTISTPTILSNDTNSFFQVVKGIDKQSFWLVSNTTFNSLYAYKIDSVGIHHSPVSSLLPPVPLPNVLYQTYSPFSSDGKHIYGLYISNADTGVIASFDFDNKTGLFSNLKKILSLPFFFSTCGISFALTISPDGSKLYISIGDECDTANDHPEILFQYDLSSGDPQKIQQSETQLLLSRFQTFNFIQGPDAKIYTYQYSGPDAGILYAINQPDSAGLKCDISPVKTLPYAYIFPERPSPTRLGFWPSFSENTVAHNAFQLKLSYNGSNTGNSFRWDFGDGSPTSTLVAPTHTYTLGSFMVRLTVTDQYGYDEVFKRLICINEPFVHVQHDTAICFGDSVILDAGNPVTAHLWSTGDTTQRLTVSKAGKYWVTYTYMNLKSTDTFKVSYQFPLTHKFLPKDTTICQTMPLTINLDSMHALAVWQDSVTTGIYTIRQSGLYRASLHNQCGTYRDSIKVTTLPCPCVLYVPNSFTPDENNLNDSFKAVCICALRSYTMQICNRWGEVLYTGHDMNAGWDGTFKNNPAPMGMYIYSIQAVTISNQVLKSSGIFTLLR